MVVAPRLLATARLPTVHLSKPCQVALEFGNFVSKRHNSKAWMFFSFCDTFWSSCLVPLTNARFLKKTTDTIERAVIEFTQIQPLKSTHKTGRKNVKEGLNNKANTKKGMDGQVGVLKAVKPNSKIKYSRTSHKRSHSARIWRLRS